MKYGLVFVLVCMRCLAISASERQLPNVVFILADDLGFNDTTLYNGTTFYETPHIQRLAARGMTFNRAYTPSPLCSPTRAAILSGQSPARTGITTPACHLPQIVLQSTVAEKASANSPVVMPTTVTRFSTDYYTLAESLRDAGYATGHFGKWHLGAAPYSPLENGFDIDVPHWPGPGPAGSYVAPWKFPDFDPDTPDQHIEDRMAEEAVAFIEQHRGEPFFLNYWMFSVHAPFDAKPSLIDKYRKRVDPGNPQRSPTYAGMVESMDDAVGTLLDTLDRLNLSDNTIIVFTSDNGGNMYNEIDGTTPTSNAPLRGGKGNVFEGGIHVPCVVCWPGHVMPASRSDALICSYDFYPTLLDMLSLKPQAGQVFDGRSFTSALRGEKFERDAIFTYFPHATRVPDWLEPSVTIHHQHWKLIRIFHSTPSGMHRYKLFDLNQDPGEKNDVSSLHPDVVARLDTKIEEFLQSTAAVTPKPNPAFDPSRYDPSAEGVSTPKNNAAKKRVTSSSGSLSEGAAELKGWKPRNCSARLQDGALLVTSKSEEAFLGIPANRFQGPAKVSVRIRCINEASAPDLKSRVQQIPSGKANDLANARDVPYSVVPGEWQEITVDLDAAIPLGIVRFYCPAAKSKVSIDWINITSSTRTELWDF
ncbi:MAG: sulfatase [Planctomycetaceae bacterium]